MEHEDALRADGRAHCYDGFDNFTGIQTHQNLSDYTRNRCSLVHVSYTQGTLFQKEGRNINYGALEDALLGGKSNSPSLVVSQQIFLFVSISFT